MRLILLILLSVCYADVIHVPADYSTIQEGINAANQDDIVVVSPATYQENIVIDKTITLTSLALFNTETETIIDSLDTWFEWGTGQYDITNDSILATIIDGSQPVNDSLGSTILIKAADDDCISPKILGFTITGGKGTLIDRAILDPETGEMTGEHTPQYLGGGLFSYVTTPDIRYNYFYNNGSMDIEEGGAVYAVSDPDDCPFPTRSRCEIDEIDFSHNFFRDNTSRLGKILANRFFNDEIKLNNCVIDYYCEETGNPNIYWVKVDEPDEVDYEETTSDQCPIDWDVWVSPAGSDDGEGSENQPFQTIGWALSVVVGTEDNPVTINLTEGTFSPSTTGESFSINMVSNVNLIGQGEEVTIMDAEQTDRVLLLEYCENNNISELTITGGETSYDGGGIYLIKSNPLLSEIIIINNLSDGGGGLCLTNSDPTLTQVIMKGNEADFGGGMELWFSDPILSEVTIEENIAEFDGGGIFMAGSNPILSDVTISANTATEQYGGGIYSRISIPNLSNVDIVGNNAISGGGIYLANLSYFTLNNVTISGNEVEAVNGGGGMRVSQSDISLMNSIIWGNGTNPIYLASSTYNSSLTSSFSNISGYINIDGDACAMPDHSIYITESGYVLYNSSSEIAGFQFDVDGATINGFFGGDAVTNGFTVTTSATTVIGFSPIGASFSGCGILVELDLNGAPIGLSSVIISGPGGEELEFEYAEGPITGDEDGIIIEDFQGGISSVIWLEGNIDAVPLFTDPENGDFTLQEESPCIDAGNPNLWYNDLDLTRNDMGATGGTSIRPSFTEYDFGEIGDMGASIYWSLSNFTDELITIEAVNFTTSIFSAGADFPLIIEPLKSADILINCQPEGWGFGQVVDSMSIESPGLPPYLFVELKVDGNEELLGILSGNIESGVYRITGNLTIEDGNTLVINPGTEFLFDGEFDFIVNGILRAEGTETDSIIFDNLDTETENKWKGFTFIGQTEETVLNYVRISGALGYYGGVSLENSNPIFTHVAINDNIGAEMGGGIMMFDSNPIMSHVDLNRNGSGFLGSGIAMVNSNPVMSHISIIDGQSLMFSGIYLNSSNPILTDVFISGQVSWFFSGLNMVNSNPIMTQITIKDNFALGACSGMALMSSNPTMSHVIISGNINDQWDSGMFLDSSHPNMNHVIISNNEAGRDAGIRLINGSSAVISNSSIVNNIGGIFESAEELNGGGIVLDSSHVTLGNSILWNNSPNSILIDTSNTPSSFTTSYSDIEGGEDGIINTEDVELNWLEGNIDADPLFIDSDNGDFTLQAGSPCIDAGTAYFEFDDEVFIDLNELEYLGFAPDLGTYEYGAIYGCLEEEACNYNSEANLSDGSCEYAQEDFDCEGNDLSNKDSMLPDHYSITNIYPNPFNPITNIKFGLPESAHTQFFVYDIRGRQIQTLLNDFQSAGYHTINWNASNYPSGIYLIRMESGSFTQTQKVVLVK